MLTAGQLDVLKMLVKEARASQHIWPEMASCEACLESAWLTSELSGSYHNLFGQKCAVVNGVATPPAGVLKVSMPTEEWNGTIGKFVAVRAYFLWFPSYADAFTHRMALLRGSALRYPDYAAALRAATAEEFVTAVSKTWSTDPLRAQKVLKIFHAHQDVLEIA